jgi:WD40 repeat protein
MVSKQIVHAPAQGLAVRSATLVARGLRDLTRTSNWVTKRIFEEGSRQVAVSSAGQVCRIATPSSALSIHDIETGSVQNLEIPNRGTSAAVSVAAAFAFSPDGRYLVAASTAWHPSLHMFDCRQNAFLGTFGEFSAFPQRLVWSNTAKHLAMDTAEGKNPVLRLWQSSGSVVPFAGAALRTTSSADAMERQTYEAEFGEEGAFSGYGYSAFNPDERLLASILEIKGDWADDSILLMNVPSLEKQNVHAARGHITHFTWTPDGRQIIYCASGQAYRLTVATNEAEELPFGADMCAHHPELPLCLCFSSWVKGSAQGRLFLVDTNRLTVYDDLDADDIGDLRWSADGKKAFAVARNGFAHIYEPSDI